MSELEICNVHKCSAVDPKVVIGEPSVVFSLAAMGCIGVL